MKIYAVGGAVRDALLGLRVHDRDWVVVGSTPEDMTALGFTPVGKDFPVFLHPRTREEYALARTERKTARGYKGFAVQADPSVTLEEDLARRDLTINAMAVPEAVAGEVAAPQQVAVDHDAALAGRIQHHVVAVAAVEGMDVKVDLDRFGVEQACRDATGVGQLHAESPWCARPSGGWRITPVSPGQSHDGNLS